MDLGQGRFVPVIILTFFLGFWSCLPSRIPTELVELSFHHIFTALNEPDLLFSFAFFPIPLGQFPFEFAYFLLPLLFFCLAFPLFFSFVEFFPTEIFSSECNSGRLLCDYGGESLYIGSTSGNISRNISGSSSGNTGVF